MARASQIKPGALVLGEYTVECLVGVGGMGSVHKAHDRDGQIVAVKVLERDEQHFNERFAREAQMLMQLEHPAIVRCIESGVTDGGDHVLILEWLDGIDLATRLRAKPFSLSEVLQLIARIAHALEFAHSRGMVHRDVKPGNIFLPAGEVASAKLLDFGMARWTAAKALTVTGTQMGTPAYMAPEQIRGERHIGPRADIFALGCVFYECLTGRPAFAGEHTMAVFYKILVEPTPTLERNTVAGTPEIGALVERMLAKHTTDRPRSSHQVARHLEEILARLPGTVADSLLARSVRKVDAITATEQHLVNVIVVAASTDAPDLWRTAAQLSGHDQPTEMMSVGSMPTQAHIDARPHPDHSITQLVRPGDPASAPARTGPGSGPVRAQTDADGTATTDTQTAPGTVVDLTDMRRLGARFEAFGARLDCLRDGSLIAVVDARTTATDQAVNAARCALHLRTMLPARPMALATGRAVVGQRQLIGEVIERAVELLSHKPEDAGAGADGSLPVRIDALTHGLLGARFVLERDEHGSLLCGEHGSQGEPRLLGRTTPFVGRRRELAVLTATFDECVEDRIARAVLVTAPPGYGKSRLEREFSRSLADTDTELEIWRCDGDPMRAGLPLDMLAQVVRSAARIEALDTVAGKRDKVRALVDRSAAADQAERVAAFLCELIKAPMADGENVQLRAARTDPRLMGDQIRRAAEELLASAVKHHPLVLILEDLHWGDRATVTVLDLALRHLGDWPLLIVAFARPEVRKTFPRLWASHELVTLELGRLTNRAARKLAQSVLGRGGGDQRDNKRDDERDEQRLDALIARADGNAFYLEELLRSAAVGQWELPETVLAMVHSRLESLDPIARRILRAGSIFGDRFWRGSVDALLGKAVAVDRVLEELVEGEVIQRAGASRFAEEVEYVFHHNLIREAAYGMLTAEDRTRGHRLAGKWLERVGESDAKVVAEQLLRGDAPEDALPYFLRAAEDALEAGAFAVADALAERGVACGATGQTLGELRRVQVEAHYWRSENAEASKLGREALTLLSLGSRAWYDAAAAAVVAWARLGEVSALEQFAAPLHRSRFPGHDRDGWLMAAAQLAKALFLHGRVDFASELLASIEAEVTELDDEDPAVAARVHRARADRALVASGDPAVNMIETQKAARRFEEAGDLRQACMERISIGYSMLELGLNDAAAAELRSALATAEHMGLDSAIDYAKHNLCLVLAYQGRLDKAKELAKQAASSYEQQGNQRMAAATWAYLAIMLTMDGQPVEAEKTASLALSFEAEPTPTRCMVLAIQARILGRSGKSEQALELARQAIALKNRLDGLDEGEAIVLLAHAEALHGHGQTESARAAIARARDRLHERAASIPRADWRLAFLENLPDHARTLELAAAWDA